MSAKKLRESAEAFLQLHDILENSFPGLASYALHRAIEDHTEAQIQEAYETEEHVRQMREHGGTGS